MFEHPSEKPSKCSIPKPNGYHQWLRTEVLPLESVLRVWKGHSRSISGLILSLLGSLWPSWGSCGSPLGRLGLSWCIFWARPWPGGDWIGFGGGQSSQVWALSAKKSFLALIPGSSGSSGSSGSGVISYGSGPPFHTRRGSG